MVRVLSDGGQRITMIPLFRTLPRPAIAGLTMRGILGCTTIALIASGLVVGVTPLIVSL